LKNLTNQGFKFKPGPYFVNDMMENDYDTFQFLMKHDIGKHMDHRDHDIHYVKIEVTSENAGTQGQVVKEEIVLAIMVDGWYPHWFRTAYFGKLAQSIFALYAILAISRVRRPHNPRPVREFDYIVVMPCPPPPLQDNPPHNVTYIN
jgi:hypothetical protein